MKKSTNIQPQVELSRDLKRLGLFRFSWIVEDERV